MKHGIAAIPDDGIGKEVVPRAGVSSTPPSSSMQRPRLRAPARVQHHAQDAVDAGPGVPEAGVGVVRFPSARAGRRCLERRRFKSEDGAVPTFVVYGHPTKFFRLRGKKFVPARCKTYRRVRSLTVVVAPGGPTRIQHMGASAITRPVDRSRDPRARALLPRERAGTPRGV
jgi:hypothetical protein